MRAKTVVMLAGVVAVLGLFYTVLADEPADNSMTTGVFKFTATKTGSSSGKPVTVIQATFRSGGAPIEIAIPNNDPNSAKADPNTDAMKVVSDLKAGDMFKARYNKSQNPKILDKIEKYTAQPADSDLDANEFAALKTAKIGDQEYQAIVLRKAGRETQVLVPNKKTDDGKTTPDEAVLSQVKKFAECDFVDVETYGQAGNIFLRSIRPYSAPKTGSFVKFTPAAKDANPAIATAEIKTDDKSSTYSIRPASTGTGADPAMLARVQPMKPNTPVIFKSAEEDGKQWLTEIRVDAAQAAMAEVTLTGKFEWSGQRGQRHDLKAVFTPTGQGQWKAVYTFKWSGADKTYRGTVTGNLKGGPVSGTGDGDGRNFTFKGNSVNGVLTFDCFETTGGRGERPQGNGTLR